ncbi:ISAs1 family transposase [Bradyrhizobium diazoefficiens]|nr:ISAs1 family transposase [Bradyrhizobium diazoefficiens]
MQKFKKAFRRLLDPRAANAKHPLLEVVLISLAAVVCGAASCSEIADSGGRRRSCCGFFCVWSTASRATIRSAGCSVCSILQPSNAPSDSSWRLSPRPTGSNSAAWWRSTERRCAAPMSAAPRQRRCIWSTSLPWKRGWPSQQKAPGRNETAGALEVLELLCLEGCIVTADALHCNRRFAQAVLERGGDYASVIKGNRGPLFETVTQQFARSGKRSTTRQIDRATHDRSETRMATVMRNKTSAKRFPGVVAVGRITSHRRLRDQRADPPVIRYYPLSKYLRQLMLGGEF